MPDTDDRPGMKATIERVENQNRDLAIDTGDARDEYRRLVSAGAPAVELDAAFTRLKDCERNQNDLRQFVKLIRAEGK